MDFRPLWVIPISVKPVEIHVAADRRLAFEVLTAFGVRNPNGSSTLILEEQEGRSLVEFVTPVRGLLGRTRLYRTVEWVTMFPPERIEFEEVEGPLRRLQDRFILLAEGNCTRFKYESRFGLGWSVFGWVLGQVYVRNVLRRFMLKHAIETKQTIEARARRSRMFPYRACQHADNSSATTGW